MRLIIGFCLLLVTFISYAGVLDLDDKWVNVYCPNYTIKNGILQETPYQVMYYKVIANRGAVYYVPKTTCVLEEVKQ
jgi:hypothetical protein